MKAKRFRLFHSRILRGSTIQYGAPLTLGLTILITGLPLTADAGIYGGSSTSSPAAPQPAAPAAGGGTTPTASDAARASARDILARTNHSLGAARALQAAARAAAAANLPPVPNGLQTGGLEIAPGATPGSALWQGADLPTQAPGADAGGLTNVTVRQTAQQALLTWQTFNVGKDTRLTFDQSAAGASAAQWIAFNKIQDPSANPSRILGQIQAQGQVYIINPNGIIFGGTSQINVHTLAASALPINDNLVARGLLNNPDAQFLFSGLAMPAGPNGTPGFTPQVPAGGKFGDVTVEAGAQITSPTNAAKVGGRVVLVGANVTNNGTISTPDGQTILASGLQVGFEAHATTDPSLRGLDVYVGAVADPASTLAPYAGTTTNNGVIEAARGNISLSGKTVNQSGALESSTSVSLNGRIDINASYNAVSNTAGNAAPGSFFLFRETGNVNLGDRSLIRILPELDSKETTVGTELALRSTVNITGRNIHLGEGATILAPNAKVGIAAGIWNYLSGGTPTSTFVYSGGQVYMEEDAVINVAGLVDVAVPVSQNIIEVQLRGAELANSPLQRFGELRGETIYVDIRDAGIYQQEMWVGTPLADLSGFVNLIQKSVGQLMVAGGTVNIQAGGSVVMQEGSNVNVSGGSIAYTAGSVRTTMLITGDGRLVDIRDARPDEVYTGIFGAGTTKVDPKWGVTQTSSSGMMPTASRLEAASTHGGAGGSLAITAPSMALDGRLTGLTIQGERQRTTLPTASSLKLSFLSQDLSIPTLPYESPTPPTVIFQEGEVSQTAEGPYTVDANGNAAPLSQERRETVLLSTDLMAGDGFGSLTIENNDGDIIVPLGVDLVGPAKGSITLKASNLTVDGSIVMAGGNIDLTTYNISLDTLNAIRNASSTPPLPEAQAGRGQFTLGAEGVISTAGMIVDDRPGMGGNGTLPLAINGGTIKVNAFSANLSAGGLMDVSGGVRASERGALSYGTGGSLTVNTGRDASIDAVLGGTLQLGATLLGHSGAKAGSLTLGASAFQIGGTSSNPAVTVLQPEFFSRGGFGSFNISGIGLVTGTPGVYTPGLNIAEGTQIRPVVESVRATLLMGQPLSLEKITYEEGNRTPVSLNFSATGAEYNNSVIVRGDLVMGAGSRIETDAKGSVTFQGGSADNPRNRTSTILGSVYAPGGSISVAGEKSNALADPSLVHALTTTLIGSTAHLSTAGKTVLINSALGLREGEVLKGGSIYIGGNIVAQAGAVLDVSGTSGTLDLPLGYLSLTPSTASLANPGLYAPVNIATDGGTITLSGGQMLYSDATLVGREGGASATGGTLNVSSNRFVPRGVAYTSADANLIVKQSGLLLGSGQAVGSAAAGISGEILQGIGNFVVDSYSGGGFDSLILGGNTRFEGNVNLSAPGSLRVAAGGVMYATGNVNLTASHVALGQAFRAPTLPTDPIIRFTSTDATGFTSADPYTFAPTYGSGNLTVTADLIDIGDLSLQGIGSANFVATHGDIRGNGTLSMAGNAFFKAGQIYTTTAGKFSVFTYDYNSGGLQRGSITIEGGDQRSLPLSAGGTISLYASSISQGGTLRAPIGVINLGWDGSGAAPVDAIAGTTISKPVTTALTLESGSVTSVSAIDPITGKGVLIPYGVSPDGTSWIDPAGNDITVSGAPSKAINLSASSVTTESGSTLDTRGGGDLYAYRWISGNGGRNDVLASAGSFAVIPDYNFDYAPYAPFNTNSTAENLDGEPGYVNSGLKVGDKVTLAAGSGLPAGTYTLLPARYALLPGAYLVTPQSGTPTTVVNKPDGSRIVSGYRANSLDPSRTGITSVSRFEVASASVFRQRSEYQDLLANTVLKQAALIREFSVPRLPVDSGYLSFSASLGMSLGGNVLSSAPEGGRGSVVDISSPVDIVINNTGIGPAGSLVLSTSLLNSFGAESLLIGGRRTTTTEGALVTTNSGNVTLDNSGGAALTGTDIILVAKQNLTIAEGSIITGTGGDETLDTIILGDHAVAGSGNGTLVRVSGNEDALVERRGAGSSTAPNLIIGANARLSGGSLTLDSTSGTFLAPSVDLVAESIALSSGQVSIQLGQTATTPTSGLILSGEALASLQQSADRLSLLSYSTLDVYGTGEVGSRDFEQLTFQARAIRGFDNGGGTVTFSARNLTLQSTSPNALAQPAGPLQGTIAFNADQITLGQNTLTIGSYANVSLSAGSRVIASGTGSFRTVGDLTVTTPLITAASAAIHTIGSDGAMRVNRPATGTAGAAEGLGAQLTLEGRTLEVNSDVKLPSGTITLSATNGDVNVGNNGSAVLSVEGTSKNFIETIRHTSAGTINLRSSGGSVRVEQAATLNVAAAQGGGDAGHLNISSSGTFELEGSITGSSASGYDKGSFSLDVGSLPGGSLAEIDQTLNGGNFTESRSYRIRNGDVIVDGNARSHEYRVAADNGSITVTGTIDASGTTGGTIHLQTTRNLTLESGSFLNAAGAQFSSAGKGGSVTLEAGAQRNGTADLSAMLDIRSGSRIDLSVAANVFDASKPASPTNSANLGKFTGTLHLRAPRNAANNDIGVAAINGSITGASSILVEGTKIYDLTDFGGTITSGVKSGILADGEAFMGAAGVANANYSAMMTRLLAGNSGLSDVLVLAPGAEIINSATAANASLTLNAANSTVSVPAGGSISFPSGTPGNSLVRSSVAGTITAADGTVTSLAANTPTAIAAGSSVTFNSTSTVTYASGTGGAIGISLTTGSTYTTGATNSVATVSQRGGAVTLNTAGTSGIAMDAGTVVAFPTGTVGTNRVRATVGGTITAADGTVTTFAANTSTLIPAGSRVALNGAGTLTFAAGGTGGSIPVALASGSFRTTGATTVTPPTGDIILGSLTSTSTEDWNLETYRFGEKSAAGVLTMRAAGDVRFYNALSDGFAAVTANAENGQSTLWLAPLMARNTLLPTNTQSWSYRITAGADLSAAASGAVLADSSRGSVLIGKNYGNARYVTGDTATTAAAIANRFQVVRTGSGDITISSARDTYLLNQFATIYTAGTQVTDPTTIFSAGDFVLPVLGPLNATLSSSVLGVLQQNYPAQYSMAGGNVTIDAGGSIARMTRDVTTATGGNLIPDSSRQMPNNWLYRRGYVDPITGEFGLGGVTGGTTVNLNDPSASTTWWVDFSNFFEGIGTLGGGDVTLTAGRDVQNIDAVAATNARMPSGRPDAAKLVELGGGDVTVTAGRNIDGGVYYVERGKGTLDAAGSITTNSTRSPSFGILTSLTSPEIFDSSTWLPTTLFVGKGGFDVEAGGDVLLGPVVNPFLLPSGIGNKFWYKTYFSTYAADSYVNVTSLGGSVTHRNEVILPDRQATVPALQAWYDSQLLYKASGSANFQPWLRLTESRVEVFDTLFGLMTPNLSSTSFTGNINLAGDITLYPSRTGQIELVAQGSINGLMPVGLSTVPGSSVLQQVWTSASVNLSDTDPASIPGVASPYAYQSIVGRGLSVALRTGEAVGAASGVGFLDFLDRKFAETGSTNGVLQDRQALHGQAPLHAGDDQPVRIFAVGGNIEGMTLFTPKPARIIAGNDISDIAFYLQNLAATQSSLVSAGRDIILYNTNTAGRLQAISSGNIVQLNEQPVAGDIQISGPGSLRILAGRNIDLGTGANNPDGTGVGITSTGNLRNPSLPSQGADLIVGAGIGAATGLATSNLKMEQFITEFVATAEGAEYVEEVAPGVNFNSLTAEQKAAVALEVFYLILRDSGRDFNNPESPTYREYTAGMAAIESLFGDDHEWGGDILTQSRDIRTRTGGNISIFAPGGGLTLADTAVSATLTPPGIITESGGRISIFTDQSVDIGIGRIFTLRGGDAIIWSTNGDIAAGSSSRTIAAAPPTRVIVDPQSAAVQTDLAGLATGGGIGVLATVEGVDPGDVDLIAPSGTIDAGDAGIRVTGNINLAAVTVVNAANISAGGNSTGAPAASAPVASVTSTTSSAAAAAANTAATTAPAQNPETTAAAPEIQNEASIITAEVIGYGGSEASDDEDEEERRRRLQQQQQEDQQNQQ